jgi:hypothetical protein
MTSVLTSLRYFRLRLRWALDDNRISIVVFAVLLIAAGATNLGRAFSARQQAAPVVLIATPTLGLPLIDAPLAVANVATLPRAVVAFHDYQRSETATALEEGRPYQVIGRASFEWLLLEVGSGAPVWVRAAAAGLVVDAALVDYAPLPPPYQRQHRRASWYSSRRRRPSPHQPRRSSSRRARRRCWATAARSTRTGGRSAASALRRRW